MNRYFFTIRVIPKEANLSLIFGNCISVLHGFIKRHDHKGIGVTFPLWSSYSIGKAISFVSDNPDVLVSLRKQNHFDQMSNYGFFQLDDICKVSQICSEVRFSRNQSIAGRTPRAVKRELKRVMKRAEERGEVYSPKHSGNQTVSIGEYHSIEFISKSNNNKFVQFIQKEVVESISEPEFTSYGFATKKAYRGTVPQIQL